MNNIKQTIIDTIESKVDVFIKVSSVQYRIRCPICGDSQRNMQSAHCYIKSTFDPNEPILYHCFKCNSSGRVNKSFLEKLDIKINGIDEFENKIFNKISSHHNNVEIITGTPMLNSKQSDYVKHRLGDGFNIDDYNRFRIVWDMNGIYQSVTDIRTKNTLPSNLDSISFLSDNNSIMLTRYFRNEDPRWRKIKIFPCDNKSMYTIKSIIDLFINDNIIVNIAEGIFDILSIYKNFTDSNNSVYIATLGSDYISGLDYAISKGLIGSNIIIRIYIDDNIDEKRLKHQLKRYKWLFNKIFIYKNIKAEDVGKHLKDIELVEYSI